MLKETQSTQQALSSAFYITGGTLRGDAACYVRRQADESLFESLSQGQFCYVLTSRQMGKSSLMIRTAERLRETGTGVVVLDLTAVGQNLTAEQWYDGLLNRIGRQLQLEDELESFWLANPRLGPLQRWMNAITEVVLPRYPGKLVIFIDEIDTVRSLPFTTDEFFAGIREFYNRRTSDKELERLTFCLLGVASPSDLIRDTRMTPFNIGRRIELHDFSEEEAAPLARGLGRDERMGTTLLNRILYWTGGHPYLTQRLCLATAEDRSVVDAGGVDRLCEGIFLARRAQEGDDNLLFVRERMLRSDVDLAGLLTLYGQVYRGRKVRDDETSQMVSVLSLSGITRVEDGNLKIRNRIYNRVFDSNWVKEHMPDAELRRQRTAYKRGLIRSALISAIIVMTLLILAIFAFQQRKQAIAQAEANRRQLYSAQMNLAMQSWYDAGITRINDLLKNNTPKQDQIDLRGFEWFYLWGLANSELWAVRQGTSYGAVAFLRNNKHLAIGSNDKLITIWDIKTGNKVMTLRGHTSDIQSINVSSDGKYLASASFDETAKIWDLTSGKEVVTLKGHRQLVSAVRFSRDGTRLATASMDGKAILWDAYSGRQIFIYQHPAEVTSLDFSPDGTMLATGCYDGVARTWNIKTGELTNVFKGHKSVLITLVYSPDGKTLVTGGGDLSARFWNAIEGTPVLSHTGSPKHNLSQKQISGSHVISIAYTPDGNLIAVASYDRLVKIYSTDSLQLIKTYKGHGLSVDSLSFSCNGKLLATFGRDGIAKIWDISSEQEKSLNDGEYNIDSNHVLAISRDNRYLYTGGRSKYIRVWDINTESIIKSFLAGHKDIISTLALSFDGRLLATGSFDKTIKIWDTGSGRELKTLIGHSSMVTRVRFSSNGEMLASSSIDNTARLWNVASGREVHAFKAHKGWVHAIAFSPDDAELVTAGDDSTIRFWSTKTKKQQYMINHGTSVYVVEYSSGGKRIAFGGMNGIGVLYDLALKKKIVTFNGHVGEIAHISFFPDESRLATGGGDGFIKIWSTATGDELLSIKHDTNILGLAISPNGKILASSEGKYIYLRYAVYPEESANLKKIKMAKIIESCSIE